MKAVLAEGIGTALLLAAVVGSGIMGERLAGGNAAIALLANSIATGFALAALIAALAPVSGAHFNPLVSAMFLPIRKAAPYFAAQFAGALLGVLLAHAMFDLPLLQQSTHARTGFGQWLSEAVATFGLVYLILACDKRKIAAAPFLIGAYIAAAYWFTASTSFANPAVTLARAFTDTFAGIDPRHVLPFMAAQAAGAALALAAARAIDADQDPNRPSV